MRKKNLLLGMVFVVVLGITGCGQQGTSVTRVETEKDYEMEADSPQNVTKDTTEEGVNEKASEAEKKASEENQKDAQLTAERAAQDAQTKENLISEEEAVNIVLNKVPGAVKTDVRMQLEMDDGHWVYEGEIIYDLKEYEFELSAENGTIMEWSVESVYE